MAEFTVYRNWPTCWYLQWIEAWELWTSQYILIFFEILNENVETIWTVHSSQTCSYLWWTTNSCGYWMFGMFKDTFEIVAFYFSFSSFFFEYLILSQWTGGCLVGICSCNLELCRVNVARYWAIYGKQQCTNVRAFECYYHFYYHFTDHFFHLLV